MAELMPGWTPEVERSFKEVLFRFLEEVHCTKAALYLLAPNGRFLLAAQYGFGRRDRLAAEHEARDAIVAKVRELHNRPLAVNHPREVPELADDLRAAGSTRLLLVPLFRDSRALGFVDARDKGGQRPFETFDLRQGAIIGGAFLELLRRHNLIAEPARTSEPAPPPALRETPPAVALAPAEVQLDEPALQEIVEAAVDTIAEAGALAVAVTVAMADGAATLLFSAATAERIDSDAITRHQAEALEAARQPAPPHGSWKLDQRRVPVAGERLRPATVASSVALRSDGWSLVLSVVVPAGGAAAPQVLGRLERVAGASQEASALRHARRGLARRLLEPGEQRYTELVAHSVAVSRLCWLMAQTLELDHQGCEQALLAGLLHDVGMRELEYARLYRHRAPSPEDRRIYRQHPLLGERLLRGAGIDQVALAVRHHHERWDGQGYPDRLSGESIPLLSRLVHVAEVFDVLTSASSYRAPLPPEHGLATLTAASGQQFDPGLVQLLARVVR